MCRLLPVRILTGLVLLASFFTSRFATAQAPIGEDVVFAEKDGLVAVEAEHFYQQSQDQIRRFYLVTADSVPDVKPDGDPPHVAGASGGAYLEILA